MRIGARIIKTGIAVSITMAICRFFQFEPAFFGAVSAVINMQPSIFLSLQTAKDQLKVHLLAIGTGIALGYVVGGSAISMGAISVIIIVLYRKLNMHSGIATGVVTAVFILGSSADQFISQSLMRTAVVLTGLGTAMAVNVFLWPPRYSRQFKVKLRESNEAAVLYFCRALNDYVHLEDKEPVVGTEQGQRSRLLNAELRRLADYYRSEGGLFAASSAEQEEWFALAKELLAYNELLTEKADRIYDLLPIRAERRQRAGYPEISREFKDILEVLALGCEPVVRVNGKLVAAIVDGDRVEAEDFVEDYWEDLTQAIEEWQARQGTDSYYFHALLEIAVTANEIKWAARDGKRLLKEYVASLK